MYDANQNNVERERRLYCAAFSQLHTSEKLKQEVFYMEHRKPNHIRIGRMAFACMTLAALLCMLSAVSYAATGGETLNPVAAVTICINGKDVSGQLTQQADGTYHIALADSENGSEAEVTIHDGDAALGIDIESEGSDS